MVRKYTIHIPIYEQILKVYIGDEMVEAERSFIKDYELLDNVPDNMKRAVTGTVTNSQKGLRHHYMLYTSNSIEANTIAHESVHCAIEVLENVNVIITGDNDEALAYLVGFLVEKLFEIKEKYEQNKKSNKSRRRIKSNKK